MTSARVVAGVACSVLLIALAGCNGEGKRVYMAEGCDECHGADRNGTMTGGPALKSTRRNWDEDRLLVYFINPDSVAESDERLWAMRLKYGSGMPPVSTADPHERKAVARYVLR